MKILQYLKHHYFVPTKLLQFKILLYKIEIYPGISNTMMVYHTVVTKLN